MWTHKWGQVIVGSDALREQKTLVPDRTVAYPMDWASSIDIDTDMDWEMAELLLRQRFSDA